MIELHPGVQSLVLRVSADIIPLHNHISVCYEKQWTPLLLCWGATFELRLSPLVPAWAAVQPCLLLATYCADPDPDHELGTSCLTLDPAFSQQTCLVLKDWTLAGEITVVFLASSSRSSPFLLLPCIINNCCYIYYIYIQSFNQTSFLHIRRHHKKS